MVSTIFCKIDGIKGESDDANHKGEIELIHVSHQMKQPQSMVRSTAGGGAAGRVQHDCIRVDKETDSSSPILSQYCCTGKTIPSIVLTFRRSDGDKSLAYLVIKLTDVVIAELSVSGQTDQVPRELVAFNYGKIEWEYTKQESKGSPGGKTSGSWDCAKNAVS